MDRNLQTWSADQGRSNAHVGNIVLYNGTDKIKVGFVDFDASCDIDDFSKSKLQEIQKIEHETIKNSIMTFPISLRPIQAKYLTQREEARIFPRLRQELVKGFEQGYDSKTIFSRVENELDFGRFLEIVEILRSDLSLVPKPVRRALSGSLEGLINDLGRYDKGYKSYGETEEDCYGLSNYLYNGKNNNLLDKCDILGKNRQYQNKILGKNLYRI